MSKRFVALALLCGVLAVSAQATDWKGRSSIGLRAPIFFPMFEGENFSLSSSDDRYEPFMAGWDFGIDYKRGLSRQLALNLSATYAITYDDSTATSDQSFSLIANDDDALAKMSGILFGVTANYYFSPDKKTQPYILGGVGVDFWSLDLPGDSTSRGNRSSTDLNFRVGAGVTFPLSQSIDLNVEARYSWFIHNINNDIGSVYNSGAWAHYDNRPFRSYLEPTIILSHAWGGKTTAPEKDSDKDGVVDGKDKCPKTPVGAWVDSDGCPKDGDEDGVFDGIDKCPKTPKGASVDIAGCPSDSDDDGVWNGIDKCENTPKGATVDATGCPSDSDKDGVFDGIDKCPGTPAGTKVDATGCPILTGEQEKIAGELRTSKITLNINYASNSFEPDDASKKKLKDIAETMKAFSHLNVEVRGYTDDRNTEEYNLKLSQNRADRVRELLIEYGVAAGRLTAKGFGENPDHFVADNKTAEGRRQNRRVELESTNK